MLLAMQLAMVSPLADWANFYVITGSSAGALTGLTFVVISLAGQAPGMAQGQGTAAYTTPTVVHFSVVLLLAMLLSAPWPALWQASVALGGVGLAAMGYTAIVTRRIRRMPDYKPVLEDWLGHAVAPIAAYATLIIAAFTLPGAPVPTLFAVAAAMTLMLLVSIHNAWDVVTYIVIERIARHRSGDEQ